MTPLLDGLKWQQVLAGAGQQCECTGDCGGSHQRHRDHRCPRVNRPGDPLHAVTRHPAPEVREMVAGAAELMAVCDGCHRDLLTVRHRALRQDAAARLASLQGGLF